MSKVERVEMDGMYVVTAADSSPDSRASARALVKAAADKVVAGIKDENLKMRLQNHRADAHPKD